MILDHEKVDVVSLKLSHSFLGHMLNYFSK